MANLVCLLVPVFRKASVKKIDLWGQVWCKEGVDGRDASTGSSVTGKFLRWRNCERGCCAERGWLYGGCCTADAEPMRGARRLPDAGGAPVAQLDATFAQMRTRYGAGAERLARLGMEYDPVR